MTGNLSLSRVLAGWPMVQSPLKSLHYVGINFSVKTMSNAFWTSAATSSWKLLSVAVDFTFYGILAKTVFSGKHFSEPLPVRKASYVSYSI